MVILPFEIHSGRDLSAIWRKLCPACWRRVFRPREKVSGGRSELKPRTRLAEESGIGTYPDDEIRSLAEEFGARGIVTASVTELAGRYSLDARYTAADPGRHEPQRDLHGPRRRGAWWAA